MKRIHLALRHMPVLLNWFYMHGFEDFTLETPWLDEPLLSLTLSSKHASGVVHSIIRQKDFTEIYESSELEYSDFTSSLVASGIVKAVSWDEVLDKIDRFGNRNLLEGDRPGRIAFDTVALIRRYYTLTDRELRRGRQVERPGWGYVITRGIMNELAPRENKYKKKVSEATSSHYPNSWFDFNRFFNQPATRERVFWLGNIEAKKMLNSGKCLRAPSRTKDCNIIDGLVKHISSQGVDLVVMSEDDGFISRRHSLEVKGIRIDRPRNYEIIRSQHEGSWAAMADMLFVLSVVFGCIRLSADGVELITSGIWAGKKAESWHNETLLLETNDGTLEKLVTDSLRIGCLTLGRICGQP